MEIVHLNLYKPVVNPFTVVVGLFASVNVTPVPDITVQVPVPDTGILAAIVAEVTAHKVWSAPALEIVTACITVMILLLENCGVHTPLTTDTLYAVVADRLL